MFLPRRWSEAGRKAMGSDGVGGKVKYTFVPFRFDKAWKLLREAPTSGETSSLTVCLSDSLSEGPSHDMSPLLLTQMTKAYLLQKHLRYQQPICPIH